MPRSTHIQVCVCVCVYMCVWVCVCLCACVRAHVALKNDSQPNDWTSVVSIWRLCRLYVTPMVYREKQAKESPK